jgi:predicted metalloprotease
MKTIAVIDKTTIYDDEKKLGYSLEEIYLFVLEKCGEEQVRLLVRRSYRVGVACNRIIKKLSEYNSLLQSEFVPESIYPLFYTFFHF